MGTSGVPPHPPSHTALTRRCARRGSMRGVRRLLLATVVALALAAPVGAHPISLTTALIDAREDQVTLELDVMVEDLVLFYELDHDAEFRIPLEAIEPAAHEHRAFLMRYLQLRDAEGDRLEGEIVDVNLDDLDPAGVHLDDLMAQSIVYTFEFPLDEPVDFLTVFQNFGGTEPIVPAEMEVWVFQTGARVEPPVWVTHNAAHSVHLDWDDVTDAEDGPIELDAARQEVRDRDDQELGITGYSRVYGYVYITRTEVRHELLIPLLTLETWIDVEREQPDRISVDEQHAAAEALFAFLRRHNFVRIDGRRVQPRLERAEFFGPGVRDFAADVAERPLSVFNARVGVIVSFPAERVPREVELEWHHFTEQMPYYRPAAYTFDDEPHDVLFDPFLTQWQWEADELPERAELVSVAAPEPIDGTELPVASLAASVAAVVLLAVAARPGARRRGVMFGVAAALALGAVVTRDHLRVEMVHPFAPQPGLADEEAAAVFAALHENVYRAFEKRDEERVYDALGQSVAGDLLESLYLEVRRGLELREQGGAVSRVQDLEIVDAQRSELQGRAFEYRCTWNVTGTVEHWGHIHTRKNQYEALFTVEPVDAGWRITGFEPLSEQRLEMRTRLRG